MREVCLYETDEEVEVEVKYAGGSASAVSCVVENYCCLVSRSEGMSSTQPRCEAYKLLREAGRWGFCFGTWIFRPVRLELEWHGVHEFTESASMIETFDS